MKILQKVVLIGFFGVIIFIPQYSLKAQDLLFDADSASAVITQTNNMRTLAGAHKLIENTLLSRIAQKKAQSMAEGSYFSHTSPQGKGPWQWLAEAGYEYAEAGENLAVAYAGDFNVVDAWMNSPSHRENLLRSSFDEIGVGQASGVYKGRPAIFTVEFLAKRKRVQ